MVSGFDNVHIRANLPRLEEAIKYGQSAGDRIYTSFSSAHLILTRLYVGDHCRCLYCLCEFLLPDNFSEVSEVVSAAEEVCEHSLMTCNLHP